MDPLDCMVGFVLGDRPTSEVAPSRRKSELETGPKMYNNYFRPNSTPGLSQSGESGQDSPSTRQWDRGTVLTEKSTTPPGRPLPSPPT